MSISLEALKRLEKGKASNSDITLIKRELTALDIIKTKRVDVELLMKTQNASDYNKFSKNVNQSHNLGQREFDFLKEVMG